MKVEPLLTWARRHSVWLGAVILSGILALYWDHSEQRANADPKVPEEIETAATHIPAGFVLVPIEVANYESLDSILGKSGVVDLYVPEEDPRKRPLKVATRVKILRAPLNPSLFAVLAPESESSKLVSHVGAFTVVVQNPAASGTDFVKSPLRKRRSPSRIQVEVANGA